MKLVHVLSVRGGSRDFPDCVPRMAGILISNFDTFHMNDPIPVHVCVMIVYVLTGYAKTENALDNELKVCS
jgi:hypothetical protein